MDRTEAATIDRRARYQGSLLGLAVGDALGTTLEFCPPGTFRPVDSIQGGGPFRLKPGQWTDDTSMALCLADSLLACGTFDPADQMRRYVRWYRQGYLSSTGRCFDIGRTTADALQQFEQSGALLRPDGPAERRQRLDHATGAGPLVLCQGPCSGNPALRRQFADDARGRARPWTRADTSADLSSVRCRVPARRNCCRRSIRRWQGLWEQAPLAAGIHEVAAGSFKMKKPPMIKGNGYVVRSLEAALWAFIRRMTSDKGCWPQSTWEMTRIRLARCMGSWPALSMGWRGFLASGGKSFARSRKALAMAGELMEAAGG